MPFPKTPQGLAQRLQRIASEQGKSYQELLTSFLIERALLRMVSDKFLYNHLVFKGGYVGQRIFETGRFTRDLEDHTWFEFEDQSNLELQKEYGGVRLTFRAGLLPKLKDLKRAQILHLDFGVGDPVTPAPLAASTQTTVGGDLISWQVYTVETICSEKLHTLVTRGSENSRSKDVFDLAILLPKANSQVFKEAIVRTFDYRGDPVPKFMVNALREIDTTLLQRGWKSALAGMKTIPEFDETFDAVVERLIAHGF
jgi:predicted nucleotidyltransferase component of viral defense system